MLTNRFAWIGLGIAFSLFSPTSAAQWFDPKSVGIPRLPGGKPDLNASWPKLANGQSDFSGLWSSIGQSGYYMNVIPGKATIMTEAGARLFRQRVGMLGSGFMAVTCRPFGPVAMLTEQGGPIRIYQNSASVALLFGNMTFRIVHTDGRALPKDPNPAWMGYSVGHWEGDTLVIASNGFREDTWLDPQGHPHSEQLRLIERLRRRDFGHLEYEVTFSDPMYYRESFSLKGNMLNLPDRDEAEYVCDENERDKRHMRSVPLPAVPVKLSDYELARYAGTYKSAKSEREITFKVHTGQLIMLQNWPPDQPFEYPMEPLGGGEFVVPVAGVAAFSLGPDGHMRLNFDGLDWSLKQ